MEKARSFRLPISRCNQPTSRVQFSLIVPYEQTILSHAVNPHKSSPVVTFTVTIKSNDDQVKFKNKSWHTPDWASVSLSSQMPYNPPRSEQLTLRLPKLAPRPCSSNCPQEDGLSGYQTSFSQRLNIWPKPENYPWGRALRLVNTISIRNTGPTNKGRQWTSRNLTKFVGRKFSRKYTDRSRKEVWQTQYNRDIYQILDNPLWLSRSLVPSKATES